MATETQTLLAELTEDRATGRIAAIYDEIRRFSGVPYVSSLQRYIATMPGALEWAWDALRPALASGAIQQTGWRLADQVTVPPLPPVPASALAGADRVAIRTIASNFLRVSPVNLMTGACLGLLLTGAQPIGAGFESGWAPPAMLPRMPGNVDPMALPAEQRAVLMRFSTEVDGRPFVPALYRQLAHWPALLAWLAEVLVPRLTAAETSTARAAFHQAAREAAPGIVARLPKLPAGPAPDGETTRRILATIDRYAETSPEMTMFSRLILDVLP